HVDHVSLFDLVLLATLADGAAYCHYREHRLGCVVGRRHDALFRLQAQQHHRQAGPDVERPWYRAALREDSTLQRPYHRHGSPSAAACEPPPPVALPAGPTDTGALCAAPWHVDR